MKHKPRPVIHVEKPLGWASKLGGAEPLGVFKAGSIGVSQVDGVSDMAPSLLALCGEGSAKGQWSLLTLMPDTSLSPCVPLMPFRRLPWCWSLEGVSLSR